MNQNKKCLTKVCVGAVFAVAGTGLLTTTTIVQDVQRINMEIEEANYWNEYFKTHHK